MGGRSIRKGIGKQGTQLIQKALITKVNQDRVTIMPGVFADGKTKKPVIILPGKLAHFRKLKSELQSLRAVLLEFYLFQRNPPGTNTSIVYEWANGFVLKTEELRKKNQKLLLLLDGYGAEVQFRTPKYRGY